MVHFATCLLPLLFAAVVSAEVACGGDGGLSVEERKVIRRAHNVRRKKLAEGKETAHDGLKMKAASNILQMKYDCELENYAQNWINKCKFDHSPQAEREGKGENIYYYGTTGDLKDRSHYLRDAAKSWWNEVKNITNVTVGDKGLELTQAMAMDGALHWSQMAWADTASLGCGMKKCIEGTMKKYMVSCNYRKQGNMMGDNIYTYGIPCSTDDDCKSPDFPKCNKHLSLCRSRKD